MKINLYIFILLIAVVVIVQSSKSNHNYCDEFEIKVEPVEKDYGKGTFSGSAYRVYFKTYPPRYTYHFMPGSTIDIDDLWEDKFIPLEKLSIKSGSHNNKDIVNNSTAHYYTCKKSGIKSLEIRLPLKLTDKPK